MLQITSTITIKEYIQPSPSINSKNSKYGFIHAAHQKPSSYVQPAGVLQAKRRYIYADDAHRTSCQPKEIIITSRQEEPHRKRDDDFLAFRIRRLSLTSSASAVGRQTGPNDHEESTCRPTDTNINQAHLRLIRSYNMQQQ